MTGHENHDIALADAAKMTKNYRDTIITGDTIAHYFGKDAIQAILNQTNCVGLRLYYAINDLGAKQIVITGVDASSNDLYLGLLADKSIPCPQDCSSANPLNSN